MTDIWEKRFDLIRGFGWMALAASLLGLIAVCTSGEARIWTTVFALLFFLPSFLYTYIVIIWHWKGRYRGNHSDLWGALILLETSGWMKLVYFFRHLIPDMRQTGRYAERVQNLASVTNLRSN